MAGIDLSNLERALGQLRTNFGYCESEDAREDPVLAQVFRAAAIQAFEFTFELSHKIVRRYLAATAANPDTINAMSFPDMIRHGYGRGIISREWARWHEYRRLRAMTSHTYGEAAAGEVFQIIPEFIDEISKVVAAIKAEAAT